MKINFKPLKASHYLRLPLFIIPLTLFFSSCNQTIAIDTCGSLPTHETFVYLKFDKANYATRVCPLPEHFSDPALFDGTTQSANLHEYWGRIFVEPLCSNGTRQDPYWIRQDPNRMWKIQLPETRCKITVQFTEAESGCTSGVTGRPYFESTFELNGNETSVDADLYYITTIQ